MARSKLKVTIDVKQLAIDTRFPDRFGRALAARLGLEVEKHGKRNAPKRSGNLQRTIRSEVKGLGGYVIAGGDGPGVSSPVVYAAIQEFGGTIRPKRAKYLRFEVYSSKTHALSGRRRKNVSPNAVRVVYAKQVTIKGKRYMRRAVDTVNPQVKSIAADVLKKVEGS